MTVSASTKVSTRHTSAPVTATATVTEVGIAAEAPIPRILVRPIPDISPPIVDSRTVMFGEPDDFTQGTLAISFAENRDNNESVANQSNRKYFEPQHTGSRDLPEPVAWVRHIAQALAEVMSGARPASQLIRWTTPEVYSVLARRNAVSRGRGLVADRAIVRGVRICEPADGVVEACAVVLDNGRFRALAMRLTGVDRRWVVSVLEVG